jgi:ribosomal protein S18 acetylase RimI-like enzyme
MAITCVDWRGADAEELAGLYAAEVDRWSHVLAWDTRSSWNQIELGRRLGTVQGLLAHDPNGRVVGWTFYLLHHDVLQIGGFAAASPVATTTLLNAILESETASRASSLTLFAFAEAPGLAKALAGCGLSVGRYDYLSKALSDEPCQPSPDMRRWRADDAVAAATLLAAAYGDPQPARPFAPLGTAEEWREYVGQLVVGAGCGLMMPDSSFVVPGDLERIAGLVLVTSLAPATAHIAQICVAPLAQRQGLGRRLVRAACASASGAGCNRMTLFVESGNARARDLYADLGFGVVASFVSAGSRQPLRLTSVAAGGGVVRRL